MDVIKESFSWLNDQLLKMEWLYNLVKLFVEKILGITMDSWVGEVIHFFIYDTLKIFILLAVLIFSISYIQSYFPPERTSKILGKVKGVKANILGALFGTITPFCSCSSIPLFIGFTKAGMPIGVTFSFLISSPLVDLASIIILSSFFGWKVAFAYVIVGLVLAVIGGTLIDKLKLEKYVEGYVIDIRDSQKPASNENQELDESVFNLTKKERINFAKTQVRDIIKKVWIYILLGVGVGAFIHGVVPRKFVLWLLGDQNPISVLLATLAGIPMYSDIFGTLSVSRALFEKGVGIGTVLAFMMAVTALSVPSMVLLSKVVKPKLLIIFVSIVTIGIILMGYLFNAFGYLLT
ncbi:permease [Haloplasma contractile]|uniref:Transporter protein n=1 Tax=Haloplasma contractile SSD-17B TaxID=1033810 RepID=U2FEW1_9MOLU|nr:permease [Haloplasma contractile]ERJ11475.1 transporter protein [Haloplasma contractile SSD-17B]